jgi:two-component system chemotaxis sensor kinase CheA
MRSFHEGGLVNIEVTDDGAGFDIGRLKVEAVRRGLFTAEQVEALSDREASSLVFLPGLTTAKEVTSLSGRGVGMDVVKTNIERIGGTIEIHSERGRGTTFRIKIPLTLAIVAAQLVGAGSFRFAIPQVNVLEVIRLDPTDSSHRIEVIHRTHVYRLRGKLLPLLFLEEMLELDVQPSDDLERSVNIVVVNAHDRVFGLVVDTLLDTQEIVVKPLAEEIARLDTYAGATIMGDGSVVLILDVIGLGRRGGLLDQLQDFRMKLPLQKTPPAPAREATLLLAAGGRRYAMPLTHVLRLETFAADAVEFSGPTAMVQHHGMLLPLTSLASLLNDSESGMVTPRKVWPVVVIEQGASRVGLVVDAIVDVVHEDSTLEHRNLRAGIAGSAVIRGRLTDVLDVSTLLRAAASTSEVAP